MFEQFLREFPLDCRQGNVDTLEPGALYGAAGAQELFEACSGGSFAGGLYRLHRGIDVLRWTGLATDAFRSLHGRVRCFGYDWMGRQFALLRIRPEAEPAVVILEPGTGKSFEVPGTFLSFHRDLLPESGREFLLEGVYTTWLSAGNSAVTYNECVGYRVPPFLGGADEIDNLERTDLEVYWVLVGQLIQQAQQQRAGTVVKGVELKK